MKPRTIAVCALALSIAIAGNVLFNGIAAAQSSGSAPTFAKDVAPILYNRCVTCHRPGEVAPMSLITYDDARPWARSIKRKVVARQMPPWFADPHYGKFKNDGYMSDAEIATISKWADAGAPKGEDRDLPAAPTFTDGWNHPSHRPPDFIVEAPAPYPVAAEGEIPQPEIWIKLPFNKEVLVEAVEMRPSNRGVVHHALAMIRRLPEGLRVDPDGILADKTTGRRYVQGFLGLSSRLAERGPNEDPELNQLVNQSFGGPSRAVAAAVVAKMADSGEAAFSSDLLGSLYIYQPGRLLDVYPTGTAKRVPADTYLVFQMHYQATGKPEVDQSKIGLWLKTTPVTQEMGGGGAGGAQIVEGQMLHADDDLPNIPPYDEDWKIVNVSPITRDMTIHQFIPHMHLRGRAMKWMVTYPDGREETLLSIPRYDFNWQIVHELVEPKKIPAGSKLVTVGHFDNSLKNRYNPAPEKEVYWGMQSWDEMFSPQMISVVDLLPKAQ